MINKETKEFKFDGFVWKLKAKVEEKDNNNLKIYLKNISACLQKDRLQEIENDENLIELEVENQTNNANFPNQETNNSNLFKKDIITIYYRLEYGQNVQKRKEILFQNININSNEEILIGRLNSNEWETYKSKELGFGIYLSIDHVHSTVLLHMADHIKDYLSSIHVSSLKKQDLISIMKYIPNKEEEQESLLLFSVKWGMLIIFFNLT